MYYIRSFVLRVLRYMCFSTHGVLIRRCCPDPPFLSLRLVRYYPHPDSPASAFLKVPSPYMYCIRPCVLRTCIISAIWYSFFALYVFYGAIHVFYGARSFNKARICARRLRRLRFILRICIVFAVLLCVHVLYPPFCSAGSALYLFYGVLYVFYGVRSFN